MTSNWSVMPVSSLVTHVIGGTWGKHPGEHEVEVAAFGTKAFVGGASVLDASSGTSRSISMSQYAKRQLFDGDIILEVSGGSATQPVGRVLIVDGDMPNVVPSSFMRLVRFDQSRIMPNFALHMLQWLYISGVSSECQSNTTGIRNLNVPSYLESLIALPPLAEQRRIVDLIGSLDEAIEIADEGSFVATSIASRLRESLFAPASASERWIISDIISKHRIPVEVSPSAEYTEIGIRSHGRGTFIKTPVSGEALGRKKVFHMTPGCLVFSVVFSWEGATALLGADCEGKIASHRFPNYKGRFPLSAELLSEFFKTAQGRQLLVDCSPGGAGRNKTLNQTALLASMVNLPLQSEWEQCLERLTASRALAESAAAHAASLRKLRSELLTSLLSGAHTIPESYDEAMTVAGEALSVSVAV